MIKIRIISLIFFIVLVSTVFNVFYKPWIQPSAHILKSLVSTSSIDPVSKAICSVYGFQCPDEDPCDCEKYCSNAEELIEFQVMEKDRIYIMNKKLLPGKYCLPKGVGICNDRTSFQFFSPAGWSCIPHNGASSTFKNTPCYHSNATDNTRNVLWDYALNQPANANVENIYETLANGNLRYNCKCDSLDVYDKPLRNVIPFVCSTDICLEDIDEPLPMMGWTGTNCECGPYEHADSKDGTSPCVKLKTKFVTTDVLEARVDCMTNFALKKSFLYCPNDEGVLLFNVRVTSDSDYRTFLDSEIAHTNTTNREVVHDISAMEI